MIRPLKNYKKIFNTLLFVSATFTIPTFAYADTLFDGWYVSGLVGGGLTPSVESNILGTPCFGPLLDPVVDTDLTDVSLLNFKYKPTFNNPILAASVGYKSGPLRYELEGLLTSSRFSSVQVLSDINIELRGNAKLYAALVNAFYDFDNVSTVVVPYVGLGIGYAHIKTSPTIADLALCEASDNRFAFQGILGTTFNFTSNFGLFVDYRYVGAAKSNSAYFGEMYQNHTFNIGFTWHIGDYANV